MGGTVAIDNSGRILGGNQSGGPGSGAAAILIGSGEVSILNRGTILGGYSAVDESGTPIGEDGWTMTPAILNYGGLLKNEIDPAQVDRVTIINAQGAGSVAGTALTYAGVLPQEYKVIVDSPTSYGQLAVMNGVTPVSHAPFSVDPVNQSEPSMVGQMAFGLSEQYSNFNDAAFTSAEQTLTGVLSGVTADQITTVASQQITSTNNAGNWQGYINNPSTHWVRWKLAEVAGDVPSTDLVMTFGPDATNTLSQLRRSGSDLHMVMRSRLGDLLTTSSYDCRYFDERGVCLSISARNGDTTVTNSTSAVVIGSLRLTEQFRVGAFFDSKGSKQSRHDVSAHDRPTFGGFVAFNQNADGSGFNAKISAATKDGKIRVTRNGVDEDFTESGSGKAKLDATTVSAEVGFGLRTNGVLITPYLGFSHSKITRKAYTEDAVAGQVVAPISYDKFRVRPDAATLGAKMQGKLNENLGYNLGAGVTGGLSRGMSSYSGTSSIIGMSSFNIDLRKGSSTGGFGSAGLSYQVSKGVYVSGSVTVRDDPYYSKAVTYSFIGLSMGL